MKSFIVQKCVDSDIARTGQFYEDLIAWLNAHINFPRWIPDVYPCEDTVRDFVRTGAQYICTDADQIIAAFALNSEPQGNYQKARKTVREKTDLLMWEILIWS